MTSFYCRMLIQKYPPYELPVHFKTALGWDDRVSLIVKLGLAVSKAQSLAVGL